MSKNNNDSTLIKILLLKARVTQAQIARENDVTRSLVNQVVAGHRKSPKIRKAIADACGVEAVVLWPTETRESA